jgi:hypothetical protein
MIERMRLPNGWSAMMLTHFPRRPIHNHDVPHALRQRRPVMVPAYNPDNGEPVIDEEGRQLLIHVKRIKTHPHTGKPVFDSRGRLQMEEMFERPSPRMPPEVATTVIIITNPEGKDWTFFGDAFLHWKDYMAFSREVGFRISATRALRQLNQLKWIPSEVRMALSAWIHGLPGEALTRLVENPPENVEAETSVSERTVSDNSRRGRKHRHPSNQGADTGAEQVEEDNVVGQA